MHKDVFKHNYFTVFVPEDNATPPSPNQLLLFECCDKNQQFTKQTLLLGMVAKSIILAWKFPESSICSSPNIFPILLVPQKPFVRFLRTFAALLHGNHFFTKHETLLKGVRGCLRPSSVPTIEIVQVSLAFIAISTICVVTPTSPKLAF